MKSSSLGFGENFRQRLRILLPRFIFGLKGDWFCRDLCAELRRLGPANPILRPLAGEISRHLWQRAPLDEYYLDMALDFQRQHGFLSQPEESFLRLLRKSLGQSCPEAALWPELRDAAPPEDLTKFIEPRLSVPGGLFWLGRGFTQLLRAGRADLAARLLEAARLAPELAPLKARLSAELALHYAPPGEAQGLIEALEQNIFANYRLLLMARLAELKRDSQAQADRLKELAKLEPWNPDPLLRLHALRRPLPEPEPGPETAILLYSYNRAEALEETLRGLARNKLGQARIFVLDNGSSDATPEVLARAARLFQPGVLQTLGLPVNLGAPAARNWLASLPELKACRYLAYVDDDVILPDSWLQVLLGAAKSHPEVQAVGCLIADAARPHALQVAEVNILPPLAGERIRPLNNCAGALDYGQFGYARPCASVSGCCHLVRRSVLEEHGAFSLSYSPSQFDDIERDLRCLALGRPAYFCGHVRVLHQQGSSLRQAGDRLKLGRIIAGRYKLMRSLTENQAVKAADYAAQLAWDDYAAKLGELN